MKKRIYLSVIIILTICLVFILYKLSVKDESSNQTAQTAVKKVQDTLETNSLKKQKDGDISKYAPKQLDNKAVDTKLQELNKELEKTKEMLKQHNKTNPNLPVKTENVDDLMSLELDKKTTATNPEKTKTQNKDIKKLQKDIANVKKAIKEIKE
jgi:peptidoglycan hydrolase CwlO-like protein